MIKWIVAFLVTANYALSAEATLLSSYAWTMSDENFGGFSSLEMDDQGQGFMTTSDHGYFWSGKINRQNGKIVSVSNQKLAPINNPKGALVDELNGDAEGIAIGPNGKIFVSFERNHRVWSYTETNSAAHKLPKHADFDTLQYNSSLEALAIDNNGWLYAVPERSGKMNRPFPIYRFNGTRWDKRLSIPRRGTFLVTGADIGPDGKLYLLERDYFIPIGIATRVRSFGITKSGLIDEQVVLLTNYGAHDNLEGISVWQDDRKHIRITLISDDNFSFFQHTELVEYVIN
jgi:hypothetical protein